MGMGEVTRSLGDMVAPGGRAIGIDLSGELVERARERLGDASNVAYEIGDVTDLPFESETFDAAYCERVFQHLADPDWAMGELFRVLTNRWSARDRRRRFHTGGRRRRRSRALRPPDEQHLGGTLPTRRRDASFDPGWYGQDSSKSSCTRLSG
jgi:SAM-dependent methyltransferase